MKFENSPFFSNQLTALFMLCMSILITACDETSTSHTATQQEPSRGELMREVEKISFYNVHGASITPVVEVEISDDDPKRMQGLMYRKSLGANAGMLFVWDDLQPRSFWMRHTYIPLDMIFMQQGKVMGFVEGAVPLDETPRNIGPIDVDAVLEVNAGFIKMHNLHIGDKLFFVEE